MKDLAKERSLWLSEEEAMGLLDIILTAPDDLTSAQRTAVLKLSDFYRQFLESNGESAYILSPRVIQENSTFVA